MADADIQQLSELAQYAYRLGVVLDQRVADATDVPVGTVRSRIHRGRSMLRGMLTWPV